MSRAAAGRTGCRSAMRTTTSFSMKRVSRPISCGATGEVRAVCDYTPCGHWQTHTVIAASASPGTRSTRPAASSGSRPGCFGHALDENSRRDLRRTNAC